MKYVRPELEEMELILEGSFLNTASTGVGIDPDEPIEGGEVD